MGIFQASLCYICYGGLQNGPTPVDQVNAAKIAHGYNSS